MKCPYCDLVIEVGDRCRLCDAVRAGEMEISQEVADRIDETAARCIRERKLELLRKIEDRIDAVSLDALEDLADAHQTLAEAVEDVLGRI